MAIASALKENASLQLLRLGCNSFSETGAVTIVKALKVNRALKKLVLTSNGTAAEKLVSACKNENVEDLDFKNSDMDDSGALIIAAMLEQNTTLKTLNLENNKIWDTGGMAIAKALKENASLQDLNLVSNFMSENATSELKVAWGDRTEWKL